MQYKDDQYAPSLHVEEFDDSLLYCGTTSLVPKTILPNSSLFVPSLCQYLHLIQALIPLSSLFISSACNISMLQIRLLAAGCWRQLSSCSHPPEMACSASPWSTRYHYIGSPYSSFHIHNNITFSYFHSEI